MTKDYLDKIDRIYDEIVGDEFTEGLIPKIKRIETTVDEHTRLFKVWPKVVAAVATFVSIVSGILADAFNLFHTNR